jgi:serine/threonine-protein kinase RIM15
MWAVGVILYEFLFGLPPFNALSTAQVFQNIIARSIDWIEDDLVLSSDVRDLMEKLMCTDVEERLGTESSDQVKSHDWFKGINWETLWQEKPLFLPTTTNIEDTGYFDDRGATDKEQQDFEDFPDEQSSEFGESVYKNLGVLEKANQKIVSKIKEEYPMGEDWLQKRRDSLPLASPIAPQPKRSTHMRHYSASATLNPFTVPKSPSLQESMLSYASIRSPSVNSQDNRRTDFEKARSSSIVSQESIERIRNNTPSPDSLLENPYSETPKLEILIADDNPITNKILENLLEDCNCVCVKDGAEAVQSAMAGTKFDVIFVTHELPIRIEYLKVVNGESVARMLKTIHNINIQTSIVGISYHFKEEPTIYDHLLVHPFTKQMLLDILTLNNIPSVL